MFYFPFRRWVFKALCVKQRAFGVCVLFDLCYNKNFYKKDVKIFGVDW